MEAQPMQAQAPQKGSFVDDMVNAEPYPEQVQTAPQPSMAVQTVQASQPGMEVSTIPADAGQVAEATPADITPEAPPPDVLKTVALPGTAQQRIYDVLMLKKHYWREKIHYWEIVDKKGNVRYSLAKAGAELIRQKYNLGVRTVDRKMREERDGNMTVMINTELFDMDTGAVITNEIGVACTDEKKFTSKGMAMNTTIAMATKRADVRATLRGVGLSEILTTDVEDFSFADLQEQGLIIGHQHQLAPVQQPVQTQHPPHNPNVAAQNYNQTYQQQPAQGQEALNHAEMNFRSQIDSCTTVADLKQIGENIKQGGFPPEFNELMRGHFKARMQQLKGEQAHVQ